MNLLVELQMIEMHGTGVKTILYTIYLGMPVVYLPALCDVRSQNVSLITMKLKYK